MGREHLAALLKRRFGVKARHIVWVGEKGVPVARVGALHFRTRDGAVQVWSGRAWVDVRNLRELGVVLADAAALGTPPDLTAAGG